MNTSKKRLNDFIIDVRKFNNIDRKYLIFPLMEKIRKESFTTKNIFKGIGEDSAAIFLNSPDDEMLVLLTTDAITEEFSNRAPWGAGFSAIMVGIDDIYACGGTALAASCIIASDDPEKREKLMTGILDASRKFKVPLVRGHTSDNTKNVEVSATIVGKILKKDYISAGGAQLGDKIIVVADFDGKVGAVNKYYWDTVTLKDSEEIMKKRSVMNKIASEHVAHASKDISNGGLFGTLLLMVQYSEKGAEIDIEKILIPEKLAQLGYSTVEFSKMYLTTAFLITAPQNNLTKIHDICEEFKMKCYEIGEIIAEKSIYLRSDDETAELFKVKVNGNNKLPIT